MDKKQINDQKKKNNGAKGLDWEKLREGFFSVFKEKGYMDENGNFL